jgi:hypothetical protein
MTSGMVLAQPEVGSMRIAWIGGLDRNEHELSVMAEKAGHALELHTGAVGGRGAGELRAAIGRADVVIIVTDVNSHGAVQLAKKVARQEGRHVQILKRCGRAKFREILGELSARAAA